MHAHTPSVYSLLLRKKKKKEKTSPHLSCHSVKVLARPHVLHMNVQQSVNLLCQLSTLVTHAAMREHSLFNVSANTHFLTDPISAPPPASPTQQLLKVSVF